MGFDWSQPEQVMEKVSEEIAELQEAILSGDRLAIEHELGDVLMSLASLGRHLDTPPEAALRRANDRFASRFAALERLAQEEGVPLTGSTDADVLDALWERAKQEESSC